MMSDVDRRAAGEFARALVGHLSSSMLVTHLELGRRTGLLEALATGPVTLPDLAARTGLVERYVKEWLGLVVTGGVVVHDPGDDTYVLPPEHAAALEAPSPYHLSGMVTIAAGAAQALDRMEQAFREGGGIGYAEQPHDVDEVIDRLSRHRYDALLVDSYLAQVPGLTDRLASGARILELGCGRGQASRLMAAAFPDAEVVGLDLSEEAVADARAAAARDDLHNVRFVTGSAAHPPAGPWDVVCAFDVIHDLAHPHDTLRAVREVLAPDGMFLMIDSGAPPTLEEQAKLPWAPMMYGVSLAHCMTVSLAQQGEGLGAMWGRDAALAALADAGLGEVESYELKGDPMDLLYVARPGAA
jgi:SAM-dependent methyltransferase